MTQNTRTLAVNVPISDVDLLSRRCDVRYVNTLAAYGGCLTLICSQEDLTPERCAEPKAG